MLIKLYIIRHGKSVSNEYYEKGLVDISESITDPQLSETGIQTSIEKSLRIDTSTNNRQHLFCSELLRSIQTGQYMFPNMKINIAPFLCEIHQNDIITKENTPRPIHEQEKYIKNPHIYHNLNKTLKHQSDWNIFFEWLSKNFIETNIIQDNDEIYIVSHYIATIKFIRDFISKNIVYKDGIQVKPYEFNILQNNDIYYTYITYDEQTKQIHFAESLYEY